MGGRRVSLAAFPSVARCSSADLTEKKQVTARLSVEDFICIYLSSLSRVQQQACCNTKCL